MRRSTIRLFFRVIVAIILASKIASGKTILIERPIYPRLIEEIEKGKSELESIVPRHSAQRVAYFVEMKSASGSTSQHRIIDFAWKEFPVKLFHIETCETRIIKLRQEGLKLVNIDNDFVLEVEGRPSGMQWNAFNTALKVIKPKGWVVIANKYRIRLSSGKARDYIYSPYSSSLHTEELVAEGEKYLRAKIGESIDELNGLARKANANLSVDLHSPWLAGTLERLVLLEHTDPFDANQFKNAEISIDPYQRVSVIIALNRESAYAKTSSSARASGLMQFTNRWRGKRPGTWDSVKRRYRWAKLPTFAKGIKDHNSSIKAAVLLHDLNLKGLEKVFGREIKSDPNLEYYLAAAYNGGVGSVIASIRAHQQNGNDWRKELRKRKRTSESLDYMDKLDFLLIQAWLGLPIWGVF